MSESGWVIELAISEVCAPKYWAGHSDCVRPSAWTTNHEHAIRFARYLDAERVSRRLMPSVAVRICEHEWQKAQEKS